MYRNDAAGKDTALPWKLDMDIDGTPRCKSYSQLSFCEEDEFAAPPATPVDSFEYAPLVKRNQRRSFTCRNMADVLSPLRDELNSFYDDTIATEQVHEPGLPTPSRLKYREPRKKEKLGFTEDRRATMSRSDQSIFLRTGIEGVNQDSESNIRRNSSLPLQPAFEGDEKKKRTDSTRITSSSTYVCEPRKEDASESKREKYCSSNDIDKGTAFGSQTRRTRSLYKHPIASRDARLTEVDTVRSVGNVADTLDQARRIVSKLWQCALLANRSSNSSMYGHEEANSVRYRPEKYTFLRKGNALRDYKRTVRLRSSTKLLDTSDHAVKDLHGCESCPDN